MSSSRAPIIGKAGSVGLSATPTLLTLLLPKCPVCLMALIGSAGVSSIVGVQWLKSVVILLLALSLAALALRAHRKRSYGFFYLGLIAAILLYLCRFEFGFVTGEFVCGIFLCVASIWSALPLIRSKDKMDCSCEAK